MLIHITGPPGSGKSYIGQKLTKLKNVLVIDTDDIADRNTLKLIDDPVYSSYLTDKSISKFFKLVDELNTKELKRIIKEAGDKIIVMVGLVIDPPKGTKNIIGFTIKIEPEVNYYRLNTRTLRDLHENCGEIRKLFKTEKNMHKVSLKMLHKFKIRRPFPTSPPDINYTIKMIEKDGKKRKYRLLELDEIYEAIKNIIP